METTNETLGMTVEKVLCDLSGLDSSSFAHRSLPEWENKMVPTLRMALTKLPRLVQHVGDEAGERGGQSKSPVDFLGASGETISVKSNIRKSGGKVCPPEVGQPGMEVYSHYFGELYDPVDLDDLGMVPPDSFKRVAQDRIADKMPVYLGHLFDCDFLLWTWLQPSAGHAVFRRSDVPEVDWDPDRFSFSRTPDTWNESCSVRYRALDPDRGQVRDIPIGEFQVHNHRSNYKFRVNLPNLDKLFRGLD